MSKKPLHILFAQMPFCRFSAETFGKLTLLTSHSTRVLLLLRRSGENEVSFYAFFLSFFSHEILPRRSCLSGPHRRMGRPLVEISLITHPRAIDTAKTYYISRAESQRAESLGPRLRALSLAYRLPCAHIYPSFAASTIFTNREFC
jgi:hypothetical protein